MATRQADGINALDNTTNLHQTLYKNDSNNIFNTSSPMNSNELQSTNRSPITSSITTPLDALAMNIIAYYIPFITLAGTIGNVLSVLVFVRTKLRKLSSSYYLAALSISDTVYLFCNLMQWTNTLNINIYNRNGPCQVFTFVSSMCTALSAWLVVAFTVERFIAVRYPLKRQTMCTVRRAKSILIVLVCMSIIHCLPLLKISEAMRDKQFNTWTCDISPNTKELSQFYNNYDTIVALFVPASLIVVLNTITAYTVWKLAGVRRTMTNHKRKKSPISRDLSRRQQFSDSDKMRSDIESIEETQKIPSCTHLNGHHSSKQSCPKTNRQRISNSSQSKVTKMLLIVSTVFVLLNSPSYAFRIIAYLVPENEKNYSQYTVIAQYISWQLFVTNFGINFILYCMSGQNFRNEFIQMFRKRSNRQLEAATQITGTATTVGELSKKRTVTRNVSWNDTYELRSMTISSK